MHGTYPVRPVLGDIPSYWLFCGGGPGRKIWALGFPEFQAMPEFLAGRGAGGEKEELVPFRHVLAIG